MSRSSSVARPDTITRSEQLLQRWRSELAMSARERSALAPELVALDRQLKRLVQRRLHLAVFGRVGVGKSSLLNALLGQPRFATDLAHGSTRLQQHEAWDLPFAGLAGVDLIDTPGIDEVAAPARHRLAARVTLGADLVLFVVEGDLTSTELEALEQLLRLGKPMLLVVNRIDCWPASERDALLASIRSRLPAAARDLELLAVSAAPRLATLLEDGRVRSEAGPAAIGPLKDRLLALVASHGPLLLALNSLRAGDRFSRRLQDWRLRHHRQAAHSLIGRFAALKATGVAANPLVLLDLAGSMAVDTALVMQLCRLYGLSLNGAQARRLLSRLSGHGALLGGAQLGIQLLLGSLRQVLLLAAPFSGGLSLAPAAPVALAQAALAVHTTRRTGELAAAELQEGARKGPGGPAGLLRRLAAQDPQVRQWLLHWP
ncbi:GTP-binding protein [Synechococcus sp. CS-1325]|uniref:GTP-binding protein n=1 Tax=Synechococcus sp. CS-1325 TaxID=2847979 RepID=UPI000DB4994A|nr:GTP-binding protein [Synechococcus sp. CS-1325]MCT0200730.1 GTP-binding protein [Synechococcus sp. CS-1325]PZV01200.1 MAG: GTPase [Cyanobium sp.]